MIKHILSAIIVAFLVVGVTLEPAPAEAAECSAGWGKKVIKLSGLDWYPAACRSTVCHVGSHEAARAELQILPLPTTLVLYFHYRASATSGNGLPACPADVNAAVFRKP